MSAPTIDQEISALAQLYDLAEMNEQPIDLGLVNAGAEIPLGHSTVALLLVAVTIRDYDVDADVGEAFHEGFGFTPDLIDADDALEDAIFTLQDCGFNTDGVPLSEIEQAWVRGLLWKSPVIQELVAAEAVDPPTAEPSVLDPDEVRRLARVAMLKFVMSKRSGQEHKHNDEVLALLQACNFTDEHEYMHDEDHARMAAHLAGRLSSLLRLIDQRHPHVDLEGTMVPDKHLRRWLKRNTKKLEQFDEQLQQITLTAFLMGTELVDVDMSCGGIVLTELGRDALADPSLFVPAVIRATPYAIGDTDTPVALMDAMIAYLGPAKSERALGVPAAEQAEMIHQYCHQPHTHEALHSYAMNYILRQVLGIQKTKPFTMEHEQLTEVGKLIVGYGIANCLEPALTYLGEEFVA
ncbi:hypothetical protein [Corynebacterium lubricantis]|uniref:hypothetical protein n=1 Tax=Corynebacterium lubricantis TaxID=541095 RepID=UPI000368A8A8|nr:hypothetical protein [Corynebacterium lubricantis]